MALIIFLDCYPMTIYKKFTSKKVLVATILGIGILLPAIFILSPYTIAQQQQQQFTTNDLNGSVNIVDDISNYLKESTKIPFTTATETAQQQITNGTVLGGHLGVTRGYLTYAYLVVNPIDETLHKVIIDAGNGQVLGTSEGPSLDSFGLAESRGFGHWRGHHGFFGGFWNDPLLGFAPWKLFGFGSGSGIW
jgi:uncharacterized membrane protein YkoI